MSLNGRDAQALVDLALSIEDRAKRLERRDPDAFRRQGLGDLHKAAELLGAAGRRLKDALENGRVA